MLKSPGPRGPLISTGPRDIPHRTHDASAARLTGDVALLNRVRGEFREMPGMRLTIDQAMRLWGLDRVTVEGLFETLVAGRFLDADGEGRYRMTHGGY